MELKPSYKSGEFYLVFVTSIVSMLVLTGVIPSEKADEIQSLLVQAIGGIVALGTVIGYLLARTELKKKQMELSAVKG